MTLADVFTVTSKEFSDIVRSKRFIVITAIFGLTLVAAIGTIYVMVRRMAGPGIPPMPTEFLGQVAFTLASTMSFLGPIMGVSLGCDTISGERDKGTLKIVLVQPVYRETIINGKFLAATSATALAIFITSLASIGASILMLGVTPTAEEAIRLSLFMIFSILFTMTYYGLAALLSTISKKTSQSVILGVSLWAIFTFVIPIVASLVAITIAPPTTTVAEPGNRPDTESIRRYTAILETISSITPNYHFNKIGQYLLNPYATTESPSQPVKEVASITSSLIYAWPNILVLTMVTTLTFIASYLAFTRQEVR